MVDISKMIQALLLAVVMLSIGVVADAGNDPAVTEYQFAVYLDGKSIGKHVMDIEQQEDRQRVDVEADFDVKIWFISMYKYRHSNSEVWTGACLDHIQARTDANGEQYFITSDNTESGMRLITHNGTSELEGCVRSFAYWDVALLNSEKLLNTQTGEYVDVELSVAGREMVEINGTMMSAIKYRLTTEHGVINLWYRPDGRWVALESETPNGMTIRYEAILEAGNASASL